MRTPSAEMPMGFVLLLPVDKLDFDVFVIIFEQPGGKPVSSIIP